MASSVLNENVQKRKLCFIVTVRIYVAYILYSICTLSSLISLLLFLDLLQYLFRAQIFFRRGRRANNATRENGITFSRPKMTRC